MIGTPPPKSFLASAMSWVGIFDGETITSPSALLRRKTQNIFLDLAFLRLAASSLLTSAMFDTPKRFGLSIKALRKCAETPPHAHALYSGPCGHMKYIRDDGAKVPRRAKKNCATR